jgi:3-methyladenine DNA glycosylase AlkD
MTSGEIVQRLEALRDPAVAAGHLRFFKCGPGQYAAGDAFLGIKVPPLRALAKELRAVELDDAIDLLQSRWHEARLLALMLLIAIYRRGDDACKRDVYARYLSNTAHINNWDLVDSSAPQIVGEHLSARDGAPLRKLVASHSLWERRIAVVSTLTFIRRDDFADTLDLAARLMGDAEDLIHKATGWMLREVGKRDLPLLQRFLDQHLAQMPRTALRYAIEKFPPELRIRYMKR